LYTTNNMRHFIVILSVVFNTLKYHEYRAGCCHLEPIYFFFSCRGKLILSEKSWFRSFLRTDPVKEQTFVLNRFTLFSTKESEFNFVVKLFPLERRDDLEAGYKAL